MSMSGKSKIKEKAKKEKKKDVWENKQTNTLTK